MKFPLLTKLFSGFALLSLLTIFSGLTTFTIIEKMAESQRSIELLHEFEVAVLALTDITTSQSITSRISAESYERFLENLEKSKKLANEILQSKICLTPDNLYRSDAKDSCRTIMREVIDVYPGIAANYFAQTYLNKIDIDNTRKVLIDSEERFLAESRRIYHGIISDSFANQQQSRMLIILLSLSSVLLTLLFGLFATRRLSRFLRNQKIAIGSIQTGNYDYQTDKDANDELGELCDFTKSLAMIIKDEIAKQEYSLQIRKDLQSQLMKAQRHESIGLLTGGIAHDFNNILTGITGYTDLALARLEDDNPVKRYLEIVAQSSQQAAVMTRKLLALNRKQESGKQILDLNTMISNLYKIMDRMIGENITLILDKSPEIPSVMADPAQIEQVLMNMAVNAKDAMPAGGKLTIKTSTVALDQAAVDHLDGVDPGDFVQVSVTDTGTGMPEEVVKQIFDPSFTTKSDNRGSGLGLPTVVGIITEHNGLVTVDSAIGRGTTLNFFLPVIDADQKVDAPRIMASHGHGILRGHETILLVDDNDTAREYVCETLEFCGYKLLTANGGNEAVKVMHQTDYPIDLLLTDVIMPSMSGVELAELARKNHPEIKVIFMSGYNDLPDDEAHGMLNPAEEFLKKPISMETLSQKVREVLDR